MTIETRDRVTVLIPDEGKALTDGETVSRTVYLGKYDSPDNWHDCEPDYDPKPPEPSEEEQQAELEE